MLGFTCHSEEDQPLPVLLSHGRRQVTHVHAGVSARDIGQQEAVRLDLQLHLPVHAAVPLGGAVQEVSGQEASETGRRGLSHLQQQQHAVKCDRSLKPPLTVKGGGGVVLHVTTMETS